jgi:hypothetical protein
VVEGLPRSRIITTDTPQIQLRGRSNLKKRAYAIGTSIAAIAGISKWIKSRTCKPVAKAREPARSSMLVTLKYCNAGGNLGKP